MIYLTFSIIAYFLVKILQSFIVSGALNIFNLI